MPLFLPSRLRWRRRREGADVRRGRVWLTPSSFSRLHRSDDVRVVVLLLHHRGRRRHHHMAGKIAGGARTALAPACSPSSGVQPAARSGWTAKEKLARGGRQDRARATQMRRGLGQRLGFVPRQAGRCGSSKRHCSGPAGRRRPTPEALPAHHHYRAMEAASARHRARCRAPAAAAASVRRRC